MSLRGEACRRRWTTGRLWTTRSPEQDVPHAEARANAEADAGAEVDAGADGGVVADADANWLACRGVNGDVGGGSKLWLGSRL